MVICRCYQSFCVNCVSVMIHFTSCVRYHLSSRLTDMRKGREGLAEIVRESMGHDPRCYNDAFIFYSRDCHIVEILHYDLNGYMLYVKCFDDGRFLKPVFSSMRRSLEISRETLILLLSTAVQTQLII